MNRLRGPFFASALMCIALVSSTLIASAAVKSVSSDGEATVYLGGNFSGDFDVAYRAVLKPGTHNKSWSTLSILLVGRKIPGPGVSIGLSSNGSHSRAVAPFTYVVYPNLKDGYKNGTANCARGCVIELRGDSRNVYAVVDGKKLAAWPRSALALVSPAIQLNAEAHGAGDILDASLTPVRITTAGRALRHPKCAFTTRGIEPAGLATLTFHGENDGAPAAFVNLSTGTKGDKC